MRGKEIQTASMKPSILALFKWIFSIVVVLRAIEAPVMFDPILSPVSFVSPITPPLSHKLIDRQLYLSV